VAARSGWGARVWGRKGAAQRGAATLNSPREMRLASGPTRATAQHGRRVGPEFGSAGDARWAMTGGARQSATAAGTCAAGLRWAGSRLGRGARREAKRPSVGNPGSMAGLGDYGLKLKRAKK
jgi:hypothetical protein